MPRNIESLNDEGGRMQRHITKEKGKLSQSLPPGIEDGIRLKSGAMKVIVFDKSRRVRRRYDWNGDIQYDALKDDGFVNYLDDPIELDPFGRRPPEPSEDLDLLGDGPIELTPSGPLQPGRDDRPLPPDNAESEKPQDDKPVELDFWSHLPPSLPPPIWRPDIDLGSDPPVELDDFFSSFNPCDPFHPLGPLGPFIEPPDEITLIFPRAPWLGPYQHPLERALMEALQEFMEEMGKAGNEGTIHSSDWEKAGQKAGQKAGRVLWKFIRDRLERIYFGGDLNLDSFCEFSGRRPWTTGIGIFLGVAGYGLYLGDQYHRKGRIKVHIGAFEFEWDSETGEWGFGIEVKFKF